jgi:hypothetical protein
LRAGREKQNESEGDYENSAGIEHPATRNDSGSRMGRRWTQDGRADRRTLSRPGVKAKVTAMLDADPDSLTPHDLASEATWADKYRDSNNRRDHYAQTQNWHFIDLEIDNPDIKTACFGRPALPPGTLASNGLAKACIVDKINQFTAELKNSKLDFEERLFALKFLLHLVGDLHQPLHTADNNDRGGNEVKVWTGAKTQPLHAVWDTELVRANARRPAMLAQVLLMQITPAQAASLRAGRVGLGSVRHGAGRRVW